MSEDNNLYSPPKSEIKNSEKKKVGILRKIGFSVLWFLALSMGILLMGGMIAGGIAGVKDPMNAEAAGEAAGQAFGEEYAGMIFLISLIVAIVGCFLGWLPGTRTKKTS